MALNLSESLDIASRTDPGKVRSHNEDSVFTDSALGLVIVADGMGGYNAGEVAAGLATRMLRTELGRAFAHKSPDERMDGGELWARQALRTEIARVNSSILQAAQSQARYNGMGTTLVMALFHDNRVMAAHVGDSRLYRMRNGQLALLTRDHSLLQEQLDGGIITPELARLSKNKNLVTRALGIDPVVEADIIDHETKVGDMYLLCSDGLNDMVEDAQIASCLTESSDHLDDAAVHLVQLANDGGGRDNISVILVRIVQAFPASRGWWARLMAWFR